MTQDSGGAVPLLHKEEAESVLQAKALAAELHEPVCSAIRDSLFRLSRNAAAREAGRGGAVRAAPMDGVVANLLFNRV